MAKNQTWPPNCLKSVSNSINIDRTVLITFPTSPLHLNWTQGMQWCHWLDTRTIGCLAMAVLYSNNLISDLTMLPNCNPTNVIPFH